MGWMLANRASILSDANISCGVLHIVYKLLPFFIIIIYCEDPVLCFFHASRGSNIVIAVICFNIMFQFNRVLCLIWIFFPYKFFSSHFDRALLTLCTWHCASVARLKNGYTFCCYRFVEFVSDRLPTIFFLALGLADICTQVWYNTTLIDVAPNIMVNAANMLEWHMNTFTLQKLYRSCIEQTKSI